MDPRSHRKSGQLDISHGCVREFSQIMEIVGKRQTHKETLPVLRVPPRAPTPTWFRILFK